MGWGGHHLRARTLTPSHPAHTLAPPPLPRAGVMPPKNDFVRAGRYDLARCVERWGGLYQVRGERGGGGGGGQGCGAAPRSPLPTSAPDLPPHTSTLPLSWLGSWGTRSAPPLRAGPPSGSPTSARWLPVLGCRGGRGCLSWRRAHTQNAAPSPPARTRRRGRWRGAGAAAGRGSGGGGAWTACPPCARRLTPGRGTPAPASSFHAQHCPPLSPHISFGTTSPPHSLHRHAPPPHACNTTNAAPAFAPLHAHTHTGSRSPHAAKTLRSEGSYTVTEVSYTD